MTASLDGPSVDRDLEYYPLDALLAELHRDGKPSLRWFVRWSKGGRDPLVNAWETRGQSASRVAILMWPDNCRGEKLSAWRKESGDYVVGLEWIGNDWTCHAREFKVSIPLTPWMRVDDALALVTPPTLAELMSRGR